MNPFNFNGPDFLVFYLIFGILVCFAASRMRRTRESGPLPQLPLNDPYLMACLGGGRQGIIRTGLVALIDQGVLAVRDDRTVSKGINWSEKAAHNEIEKTLLEYVKGPINIRELFGEPTLSHVTMGYEERLKAARLLPSAAETSVRRWLVAGAVALLLIVSWIKTTLALERGHKNIGFLTVMTIVFVIVVIARGMPRRTWRGDEFLKNVQGVFGDVKARARSMQPGSATSELLWLTAVFGLGALPTGNFPFVKYFRPANNVTGGSTCGSGCGSSSGGGDGGGGSGCGGGGCGGGGCGGCGG